MYDYGISFDLPGLGYRYGLSAHARTLTHRITTAPPRDLAREAELRRIARVEYEKRFGPVARPVRRRRKVA